jgi:hypothetical protein
MMDEVLVAKYFGKVLADLLSTDIRTPDKSIFAGFGARAIAHQACSKMGM